jgi:hypothetical protein
VIGYTEARAGGSVIDSLLKQGQFSIRALSRDVLSAAAQALIAKGVEVVSGSLMDKESLMNACKDVYAVRSFHRGRVEQGLMNVQVYGVSIPRFVSGQDEFSQGQNLVDACKANNVELLVWSSQPSTKETSNGRYAVEYAIMKSPLE